MDTSKIIIGTVGGGRYTVTAPIVKEDYGLYLQIEGIELPETYEVDFSNDEHSGSSVTMIGNADGVLIPSQFVKSGKDVFAFLYHVGADYGRTVFKFRIPNKLRPDRTDEQPTPEEQSVIDQTISALNDAVDRAEDAEQAIENMSVSAQTLAEGSTATVTKTEQEGVVHLEFGIPKGATGAQGERGEKGDKGDTGAQGIQGIQGERGLQGAKGDKGDKGDTGATGAKGEQGERGPQGIQGETGPQGPQGDDYILTAQDKQDIAELVDAGGVVVNATLVSGTQYTIDSTYDAIKTALSAGKTVVVMTQGMPMPYVGNVRLNDEWFLAFGVSTIYDNVATLTGFMIPQTYQNVAVWTEQNTTIPTLNDVQINGTSIVSDGVANVPVATDGVSGVARFSGTYGLRRWSDTNPLIVISSASSSMIKSGGTSGTSDFKPLTPNRQHESTFYGLARASGDTTQSQSSNAVGVYTEDAKSKIQDMIGIDEWKLVAEETLAEDGYFDITIANSAREVYIYAEIEIASGTTSLVVEAYSDSGTRAYYQTFGSQISSSKKAITVVQLIPIATEIKALAYFGKDVYTNSGHFDWQHKSFNVGKLNRFRITAYGGTIQIPAGSIVRIFAR